MRVPFFAARKELRPPEIRGRKTNFRKCSTALPFWERNCTKGGRTRIRSIGFSLACFLQTSENKLLSFEPTDCEGNNHGQRVRSGKARAISECPGAVGLARCRGSVCPGDCHRREFVGSNNLETGVALVMDYRGRWRQSPTSK